MLKEVIPKVHCKVTVAFVFIDKSKSRGEFKNFFSELKDFLSRDLYQEMNKKIILFGVGSNKDIKDIIDSRNDYNFSFSFESYNSRLNVDLDGAMLPIAMHAMCSFTICSARHKNKSNDLFIILSDSKDEITVNVRHVFLSKIYREKAILFAETKNLERILSDYLSDSSPKVLIVDPSVRRLKNALVEVVIGNNSK